MKQGMFRVLFTANFYGRQVWVAGTATVCLTVISLFVVENFSPIIFVHKEMGKTENGM
jgi:hypothetical protein